MNRTTATYQRRDKVALGELISAAARWRNRHTDAALRELLREVAGVETSSQVPAEQRAAVLKALEESP